MDFNNNKQMNQNNDTHLFSTSLIFEQNIDKLWLFLRDLSNETKIIDYLDNLQYVKGKNTWSQGNIFSFKWIGLTPLNFKCIKMHIDRNKKELKWKAKADIGLYYYRQIYLYRITQSDKTLVKLSISKNEKENDLNDYKSFSNYFSDIEFNILLTKSKYLQNLKEDYISYESSIINKNYLYVWNFILDFKKRSQIFSIFFKNIEYNEPKIREGSFIKFYLNDLRGIVFMRVIEIKTYKKKKKCSIKLENIGSDIGDLPKIIEYKLMILDNNKTQLSITDTFHYGIKQDYIEKMRNLKINAIKKYKKYLEEHEDNEEIIINKDNSSGLLNYIII